MEEKPQRRRRSVLRRFIVADRSMEPTLVAGQGLVGAALERVRAGELRVFPHPQDPTFWLVKRVDIVHDDATMTVLSDNAAATLADSRTFGPVPVAGTYRVLLKVPLRLMG